jgi:cytidylate kinase
MQRSPRNIDRIIEEQVERWRVERTRTASPAPRARPVITVSRQFGARGAAVGHAVADRLGWSYWNRELVDEIAHNAHVSERLVRAFDERHQAGVIETLRSMVNFGPLSASDYFRELARVVHTIASHGDAVIVGRGVAFMLDPAATLRLRVVSPMADRIAGLIEREGITEAAARAEIASMDAQRREFVRDHYALDADDPSGYDLHVNTGTTPIDQCAEVVVAALRARFGAAALAAHTA